MDQKQPNNLVAERSKIELNVLWEIMCEGNLGFGLMSRRGRSEEKHTHTGNLKCAEVTEEISYLCLLSVFYYVCIFFSQDRKRLFKIKSIDYEKIP